MFREWGTNEDLFYNLARIAPRFIFRTTQLSRLFVQTSKDLEKHTINQRKQSFWAPLVFIDASLYAILNVLLLCEVKDFSNVDVLHKVIFVEALLFLRAAITAFRKVDCIHITSRMASTIFLIQSGVYSLKNVIQSFSSIRLLIQIETILAVSLLKQAPTQFFYIYFLILI